MDFRRLVPTCPCTLNLTSLFRASCYVDGTCPCVGSVVVLAENKDVLGGGSMTSLSGWESADRVSELSGSDICASGLHLGRALKLEAAKKSG